MEPNEPSLHAVSDLTVDAYVRPAQVLEPIDAKIETLRRLAADGAIDGLTLHAWPDRIALSERTPYVEAIDAFERMSMWADAHDVSIRPPFAVQRVTSTVTGETRTELRTPMLCLTVSVGGRLANVFPHTRGEDTVSATDAIASLRTGAVELLTAPPAASAPAIRRCPACDDQLINVQGIKVCGSCDHVEPGRGGTAGRGAGALELGGSR